MLVGVILTGCVSTPKTTQRQATFMEEEYALYRVKGSGRIVGQVFMKTRGGDVKYGAGSRVALNPVTSYSTEWFNLTMKGVRISEADSRVDQFSRKTIADASGSFEFTDLPAGSYYIVSQVVWEHVSGSAILPTGGMVGQRVGVTNDQTTRAILTK